MKIFNEIPLEKPSTPLLDKVNYPGDIRSLSINELQTLANELREYLLYSVGQSGGHLGGGLGVIELTIILHYLYNTPYDNLVWDVGHQAYPHKILTDRKNFKQKLVQCPIIFPPIITILWGRNNEGKNINEIKVIPEKKKIENITFLIILIEF